MNTRQDDRAPIKHKEIKCSIDAKQGLSAKVQDVPKQAPTQPYNFEYSTNVASSPPCSYDARQGTKVVERVRGALSFDPRQGSSMQPYLPLPFL